jgi:hypothetical protein
MGPMDTIRMERILAGLRPEEIPDIQGMIELWEKASWIDREEAAEWRRQVVARASGPLER